MGQVRDPVRTDDTERREQLGVGGGGGGDGQVVTKGVGEDVVFLGDQEDVLAEQLGW